MTAQLPRRERWDARATGTPMRRFVWLSAVVLAASTGCGDSLVGPVKESYTST